MSLYRYLMLPFSLIALTFFGYDQVAAEWHRAALRKSLADAAGTQTPELLRLDPAERLRHVLRQEEAKARARGEDYRYALRNRPDHIEVAVQTTYRTRIAHYMGKPTLPADFEVVFNLMP